MAERFKHGNRSRIDSLRRSIIESQDEDEKEDEDDLVAATPRYVKSGLIAGRAIAA